MRPAELDHAADDRARDDDVVDGGVPLASDLRIEGRQLHDHEVAGEDAREPVLEIVGGDRRQEAHVAEVDADDGRPRAESPLERAQHRAVAAEHDDDVGLCGVAVRGTLVLLRLVRRIHQLPTPVSRATFSSRASASPITSGLPCVTTAAFRTGSADGIFDPVIELIGQRRIFAVDEVEEELSVPLRAGQPRVYDADRLGRPRESGLCDGSRSTRRCTSGSRTTPPFPTCSRPASNCGLTSTSASQPGRGESKRRRQRGADADERDVAGDEVRRERETPSRRARSSGRAR